MLLTALLIVCGLLGGCAVGAILWVLFNWNPTAAMAITSGVTLVLTWCFLPDYVNHVAISVSALVGATFVWSLFGTIKGQLKAG